MSYTKYDNKYLARNYFVDRIWATKYWPGQLESVESDSILHTPAYVLSQLIATASPQELIAGTGIGFFPVIYFSADFWPAYFWPVNVGEYSPVELYNIFVSHMPSEPNDAIAVFDTPSIIERKSHTGTFRRYYGVSVLVRSFSVVKAREQMNSIFALLEDTHREELTIEQSKYRIDNVAFSSGINHLGCEPFIPRRHMFSLNLLTTLKYLGEVK